MLSIIAGLHAMRLPPPESRRRNASILPIRSVILLSLAPGHDSSADNIFDKSVELIAHRSGGEEIFRRDMARQAGGAAKLHFELLPPSIQTAQRQDSYGN